MSGNKKSLTERLLISDQDAYARATRSPFLTAAAAGTLPKDVLGRWLANDRLYIHAYIKGVGQLLSALTLPDVVPTADNRTAAQGLRYGEQLMQEELLQWLIDALVNVRREEKFFVETAGGYGIGINLPTGAGDRVDQQTKLPGLVQFEQLFGSIGGPSDDRDDRYAWLEGAVVLYATEKCYLDAWTGARDALGDCGDGARDADGGALRKEFIPNWSSAEFRDFVDRLGAVIDRAFRGIDPEDRELQARVEARALQIWKDVLCAEEAFWPALG
ncbi:hypothetical protein CCHL11_07699 [Colletotrichum chlorophyti]|uniref:Thiaminase-2/PQQC domain-containing protein n=1 Tax=Colletotrichum chlorophyti TaxID=708187 RepID=A0A1Q8RCL6_9PEZI|nr:hypothetical protein CCHL11_07699 [Colletotrichum chlorophyti]